MLMLSGCGLSNSSQNISEAYNAARKGDWEKAKGIAEHRIKEVPTDIDAAALLSLALFYTERDNPESMNRAMNYIRQAVTGRPERYDLALVYGWMLLNSGLNAEAKQPLQTAYDLHLNEKAPIGQETQGTIKYALGICCLRNNTFDDAERYLTQALKSTPYSTWSRIYSDIGCSMAYRQDYAKAFEFMNKAIALEKSRGLLRTQKIAELEQLKAKNATEASIKKKQKEIDELAPDEQMYVVYLNMTVICDYLSYRDYNPENPEVFRNGVPRWYIFVKNALNDAKAKTNSAKEKAEFTRLVSDIDRRLAVLSNRK
ncbi:MAG: hypothetical protein IJS15_04330 [Victivallales bacterium]|nr:hypothetical protein [Victivallales bacterium]